MKQALHPERYAKAREKVLAVQGGGLAAVALERVCLDLSLAPKLIDLVLDSVFPRPYARTDKTQNVWNGSVTRVDDPDSAAVPSSTVSLPTAKKRSRISSAATEVIAPAVRTSGMCSCVVNGGSCVCVDVCCVRLVPGVFRVESSVSHIVRLPESSVSCDCEFWKHGNVCYHIGAVFRHICNELSSCSGGDNTLPILGCLKFASQFAIALQGSKWFLTRGRPLLGEAV